MMMNDNNNLPLNIPEMKIKQFGLELSDSDDQKNQCPEQDRSEDFLVTIFASALYSLKTTALLKPYPSDYFDENLNEIDRDRLIKDFEETFDRNVPQQRKNVNLIKWILSSQEKFQLTNINLNDIDPEAHQALTENLQGNRLKPKYLFQITYPEESSRSQTFSRLAKQYGTFYAFHGTAMKNVHSIVHHGLINSLNKRSMLGKGTYLSSKLQVAILFSPFGANFFPESRLGKKLSCVALCEVVDHPDISLLAKDTYYVITNDELIRVAYLLLYSSDSSTNNLHHLNVSSIPLAKPDTSQASTRSNLVFLGILLLFIFIGFFMTKSSPPDL